MENNRQQEIFFIAQCDNLVKNFKDKTGLRDYFRLVCSQDHDLLYNIYLNLKKNNPIELLEIVSLIYNQNITGVRRLSKFFKVPENKIIIKIKELDPNTFLPYLNDILLQPNDFILIKAFLNSHCLFNKKTSLINKYVLN